MNKSVQKTRAFNAMFASGSDGIMIAQFALTVDYDLDIGNAIHDRVFSPMSFEFWVEHTLDNAFIADGAHERLTWDTMATDMYPDGIPALPKIFDGWGDVIVDAIANGVWDQFKPFKNVNSVTVSNLSNGDTVTIMRDPDESIDDLPRPSNVFEEIERYQE